MLWIFDAELEQVSSGRLLLDGMVSLIRQRCRLEAKVEPVAFRSAVLMADPGIGMFRLLQAAVLAFMLVGGFMVLLGVRVPLPFSLQHPSWTLRGTLRFDMNSTVHVDRFAKK